eukprot:1071404-Pyramimonas_sp.AAC.1
MFQLVSRRRSRGVTAGVAARTPWETAGGQPRADSVATMFVSCPGKYELRHGLGALHDGPGGFLTSWPDTSFYKFDYTNGPGKMLETSLPEAGATPDKLRDFEMPSDASEAA